MERTRTNRVAQRECVSALHPDNGALLHDESVIGKKRNLHLEFDQEHVTIGMRSPWKLLVDVVS